MWDPLSLSPWPTTCVATTNLPCSWNNSESLHLTVIVWEADAQMNFLDLLFKEILLVEEKHDGGQCKEPVVADTVE